jgi:putative aldouronate transport system permease protein
LKNAKEFSGSRKNKIHLSLGDHIFIVVNRIVLVFAGIITLFPFLYVLAISLLSAEEYSQRGIVIPMHPTLDNYRLMITSSTKIQDAYVVTIFMTLVGTFIALMITAMLAYGLSKRNLPGHKFVNTMLVITMFFGGGMIPTYMIIKALGLMNTLWALILPASLSVWNTFVMRTFFKEIPDTLEESARLDGADDFVIAFRIVFPLSKASFATIALFYAVGYWNEWYAALLYLNDTKMYPLQMALRDIISQNAAALDVTKMAAKGLTQTVPSVTTKMTAIMVSTLPILCIYPFVQKYFIKGVLVGSLKG